MESSHRETSVLGGSYGRVSHSARMALRDGGETDMMGRDKTD